MNYAIFDMDDTLCTLEHRRNKAMESGKINFNILFDPKLVEYDLPEDQGLKTYEGTYYYPQSGINILVGLDIKF